MHFAYDKNEHQVHATRHSGATIGFKHSDLWTDIIVRDEHGEPLAVLKGMSLGNVADIAAYLTAFVQSHNAQPMIDEAMPEMIKSVERHALTGIACEAGNTEAEPPETIQ